MKRLLGLVLIVSLMAAPVMAQQSTPAKPKSVPGNGQPASTPSGGQPSADTPTPAVGPAGSARMGGKDGQPADPNAKKDPKGGATGAGAEAKKAWEEAAKPGAQHKLLEWFEGEWQAEMKDLMPGQESTDQGTQTNKMVYGGRFLRMQYDGRLHGKFFSGGGLWGYNNVDKRFEQSWGDSAGTALSYMTGSVSSDGKVFTMTGEVTDAVTKKRGTQREVTTITGKDTYKLEIYSGDVKAMEIGYTRGTSARPDAKKEEPKPEAPKGK